MSPIVHIYHSTPMQLVTPSVVAMAVRMLMMSCKMNFQVSFFIVFLRSPHLPGGERRPVFS